MIQQAEKPREKVEPSIQLHWKYTSCAPGQGPYWDGAAIHPGPSPGEQQNWPDHLQLGSGEGN